MIQGRFDNLSGRKYGNILVHPENKKTSNGGRKWLVECQCPLKTKWWAWAETIKNCPDICCKECRRALFARSKITHGGRWTPLYHVWRSMVERCSNPNHPFAKDYIARGIIVCDRWKKFENFRADMGDFYHSHLTIERINNHEGYRPGNCKWDTMEAQANNRRTNVLLTHDGKTQTISQWSKELHIDKSTIRRRVIKGWPHSTCLSRSDFRK